MLCFPYTREQWREKQSPVFSIYFCKAVERSALRVLGMSESLFQDQSLLDSQKEAASKASGICIGLWLHDRL